MNLSDGHDKVLITGPEGSALGITSDESSLLELSGDELRSIDARTGKQTVLAHGNWTDFHVDESGLLLQRPTRPGEMNCYSRLSSETHQLTNIGPCTSDGPGIAFSPDGQSFVCSESHVNTELKYTRID